MRGCALRKVVRNLAHKKLENRGVEPQHLPSQIPRPVPPGLGFLIEWVYPGTRSVHSTRECTCHAVCGMEFDAAAMKPLERSENACLAARARWATEACGMTLP